MNLYPWDDCVASLDKRRADGFDFFQQFNCAKCGTKQTMPDANILYKTGKCEECGHVTDIRRDGMNYMLSKGAITGSELAAYLAKANRKPAAS